MNIKEAIERGLYPKDEKGRALVPTKDGRIATILSTDLPPSSWEIVGFVMEGVFVKIKTWAPSGYHSDHSCVLLPPPPRKVKVKAWVLFNSKGEPFNVFDRPHTPCPGMRMVELTGSYEEPWS